MVVELLRDLEPRFCAEFFYYVLQEYLLAWLPLLLLSGLARATQTHPFEHRLLVVLARNHISNYLPVCLLLN